MPAFSEKAKLIAAAVFGGVVVISGAAGAATGSLPLVSHGHSHPAPATSHTPDGTSDDQGDVQDSTDTSTSSTDTTTNSDNANNDHGSLVSSTAHNAPQGHKGPAVCAVASNNKCKAGQQHGQNDATTHGKAGTNTNATTHRQNTATTHGQAGTNTNATTHRQNTTHTNTHSQAGLPHGNAPSHS